MRSHVDGWISCELQLCCCTATKKADTEPETLIIFLVDCAAAAAGACAAYNISTEAERGTGYCFFLPRLSFTLRCFGRLLLQLFLAASISVI